MNSNICDLAFGNRKCDIRKVYNDRVTYLVYDTNNMRAYRLYTIYYSGQVKIEEFDGIHILPIRSI